MVVVGMSMLANTIQGMAHSVAQIRGSKRRVIFDEGNFRVEYVQPEHTTDRLWEDHYPWGCMYYQDYANPIGIRESDLEGEDLELWTTDYMELYMAQDTLAAGLTTKIDDWDRSDMLQMATIALLMIIALALFM